MSAPVLLAFPVVAGGFRATVDVRRSDGSQCPTSPGGSHGERPVFYDSFDAPRAGDAMHRAIDITCALGQPIVSPVNGQVPTGVWRYSGENRSWVGTSERGGNYVWIRADDGSLHYFAHLQRPSRLRSGQRVRVGELIGYCGRTGNAENACPHLHYAIERGGQKVNPYPLLRDLYERGDWQRSPIDPRRKWWWIGGGIAAALAVSATIVLVRRRKHR